MLGLLVRLQSGRFFDEGHFVVRCLDAAVVHWLASGVAIATRDVESLTTLPTTRDGSAVRTVTQWSN